MLINCPNHPGRTSEERQESKDEILRRQEWRENRIGKLEEIMFAGE
jgi:hypothetical protein